jgi:hypothetical protein
VQRSPMLSAKNVVSIADAGEECSHPRLFELAL